MTQYQGKARNHIARHIHRAARRGCPHWAAQCLTVGIGLELCIGMAALIYLAVR